MVETNTRFCIFLTCIIFDVIICEYRKMNVLALLLECING